MLLIKTRDPAIAGDSHQTIGGKQQPRFRQAHAKVCQMQRQQQVQYGVARQRQAKRCRGVFGIALCGFQLNVLPR